MTSTTSSEDIVKALEIAEVDAEAKDITPNYNVAPTQDILVATSHDGVRTLEKMRWGLVPFFSKDVSSGARMINARSDSVTQKPAYRQAFKKRRCLIPVSGYYEWQKLQDRKQPWYFTPREGEVLAFAGLYEIWRDPKQGDDAEPMLSCTIITTDANADVEDIHNRMPLTLPKDEWDVWLQGDDEASELLKPPETGMLEMYKISTRVNNVRNNGPGLIEPF